MERFTRLEAARYCGVSVITIDRALAKRIIRHFRIGRRVVFAKEHLDEYLRSCECLPAKSEACVTVADQP
jgi:excisionase family DNA binding protein